MTNMLFVVLLLLTLLLYTAYHAIMAWQSNIFPYIFHKDRAAQSWFNCQ